MKDEFTTVPVLENFFSEKAVGELRIRTDALPSVPGFVFSMGFRCLEKPDASPGEIQRRAYVGKYELVCVSLTSDENYIEYLRQVGKLPLAEKGNDMTFDQWFTERGYDPQHRAMFSVVWDAGLNAAGDCGLGGDVMTFDQWFTERGYDLQHKAMFSVVWDAGLNASCNTDGKRG